MEKVNLITNPNGYAFYRHGFLCLIKFNDFGSINGYVQIPTLHPAYQKKITELNYSVHGGITFSGKGIDIGIANYNWWIGFDTMHVRDWNPFFETIPALKSHLKNFTVKTESFVHREIDNLTKQLLLGFEEIPKGEDFDCLLEVEEFLKTFS